MNLSAAEHRLLVEPRDGKTHGACSCGQWERDAGADTVTLMGLSREEALRSAHELHARGLN